MVERRVWRRLDGKFSKPGFGIPTDLVRDGNKFRRKPLPKPIEIPIETSGFVEVYFMFRDDKRKKSKYVRDTTVIWIGDPRDFFLPEFEGQIRGEKKRSGGDAWQFHIIRSSNG